MRKPAAIETLSGRPSAGFITARGGHGFPIGEAAAGAARRILPVVDGRAPGRHAGDSARRFDFELAGRLPTGDAGACAIRDSSLPGVIGTAGGRGAKSCFAATTPARGSPTPRIGRAGKHSEDRVNAASESRVRGGE
jgi:hypothetical protein